MNRLNNYVLVAAGFAVLVMVVGVFSAGPAIAQAVRAALVSNVDEPGRIPYSVAIHMEGACLNECLGINQHPVQAGKRLVITNVAGSVYTTAPRGTLVTLDISNGLVSNGSIGTPLAVNIAQIPMNFSGFYNGYNLYVFNQQVQLFYDPGAGPNSRVVQSTGNQNMSGDLIMSGYLLDCTTASCAAIQP